MPNEAVGKVPKIKKRPNWGYQNGTFARDLFLYAKYGRLFFSQILRSIFFYRPNAQAEPESGDTILISGNAFALVLAFGA